MEPSLDTNSPHWRTRAVIDVAALIHNTEVARRLAGKAKIIAVVKADGYGHGIENIAPHLRALVDYFAVATVEEGIACRQLVADPPIILLSGFYSPVQIDVIAQHRLQPVIYRQEQLDWLESSQAGIQYWLKLNSGMNRLGLTPQAIRQLLVSGSVRPEGILSHLTSADEPDSEQTERQMAVLANLVPDYQGPLSLVNSAGLVYFPNACFDIVRPGLMLYGISPSKRQTAEQIGLRAVMSLQSRVLDIRTVHSGDRIGYNGGFIAPKPMRIGILSIGYGDGYPWAAWERGYVSIRSQQVAIVGRVSMDMLCIDLTDCSQAKPGDIAELWGGTISVNQVAAWAGTIPYELVCGVSSRVPRCMINQS